ncbi:MAG TPA: PAS domain S-box protein [Bacteroidota bacterium]|nr:PAS domain S-box protein [Bacteroidota bacterium]
MEQNAVDQYRGDWQNIMDHFIEGCLILDAEGRCVYVNHAAMEHLRRPQHELIGASYPDIFRGVEFADAVSVIHDCLGGRREKSVEVATPLNDGSRRVLELKVMPQNEFLLLLSQDTTSQKEAERGRREAEDRLNAAFHSSPAGIALSRKHDGKFIDVNEETCRIYGFTRDEIIGKTSVELGILEAEARRGLLETLKTHNSLRNHPLQLRRPSGEIREVLFSWEAVEIQNEACMVATIVDITEQKKLYEQNLQLQRLDTIGSLAGGIVHDMNNILGPILMALTIIKRKISEPGDKHIVELLETNAKRAADLSRQILTFARGSEMKRAPLDLGLVVKEVNKLIESTFPANILCRLEMPKGLWHISADATQVHQLLMNLSVNARDAMPNGGELAFEAENASITQDDSRLFRGLNAGLYVLLKVSDEGMGMTPEIREKIFDPFFTTKEVGKGTGLGLSTVSTIVRNHGGFLDVYSEVGKGTQFRIYLPAVESESAVHTQREMLEAVQGNGELILLVDNDAIIREIATISMRAAGYKVLNAADGTEAIGLYGKHMHEVSLVITDFEMPSMNGDVLVQVLRKMNNSARIVGSSGSEERSKFEASGINAFLPKPYTSESLLRFIRDTLRQTL